MEISIWYFHLFCQILGLQNVMDMHNFCKISVYKIGKFDRIVNICYQKLSSCSSPSSSLFYLYVLTLFDFFLYSDFFRFFLYSDYLGKFFFPTCGRRQQVSFQPLLRRSPRPGKLFSYSQIFFAFFPAFYIIPSHILHPLVSSWKL